MRRKVLQCIPYLLTLSLYSQHSSAQVFDGNAEWTWMFGNRLDLDRGVAGQKGVPAPNNRPPSRWQALTWTGNDGRLWLFGGEYNNGQNAHVRGNTMNDLWVYDITTDQWAWMGGIFNPTQNYQFGDTGNYGTINTPGANLIPRARRGATGWKDASGKFWLFGGWCADGLSANYARYGYLNDLWNFDPTTGLWTWVSGSRDYVTNGNYGIKGTPSNTNMPGGRGGGLYHGGNPASWVDANGDFWIFGGHGYAATGNRDSALNDMWRYSPSTGLWTWESGTDVLNDPGVYGTMGVPDVNNIPPARYSPSCWQANGLFYLFGGRGYSATGSVIYYNDLWTFNPATKEWTWINGSSQPDQPSNYGVMGVPAPTNQPGARASLGQPRAWSDMFGKFWIYGGLGYGVTGSIPRYLSDLWQYDPTTNTWTYMKDPNPVTNPNLANPGTMKVRAATNHPASKYGYATWTDLDGNFWLFGGITLSNSNNGNYTDRSTSDLWRLDQKAVPPPPPVYSNAPANVCAGDTGVVYTVNPVANATSYEWIYTGTGVTLRDGATTTTPSNRLDFAPNATGGTLRVRSVNLFGSSTYTDTLITINPVPNVDLGSDIDTCGIMSVTLNAPQYPNATYTWSNGTTTPSNTVTDSARHWVTVNVNGCIGSDTILVNIVPLEVDLGPDTVICDYNLPLTLSSQQRPDIHFLWSNGLSTREMDVNKTGKYWVEISFKNCKNSDTIQVEVVESVDIFLGQDTTICEQFPLRIGTELPGYTYLWNTGATTSHINVDKTGTYIYEATLKGCTVYDTIEITALPIPPVNLGPDGDICEAQTLILDGSVPDGVRYEWNTGASTPTLEVTQAGTYSVTTTTRFGCVGRDTIKLSLYPDPIVFLPRDTVVCAESPLVLAPQQYNAEYLLWSDGSEGNTLTVINGGVYTVTAVNKCATDIDTIVVDQIFCDIWVPGAFSPNGDGKNDVFRVLGNLWQVQRFGLSIYNRWGERVFHTRDKAEGWDGFYKGVPAEMSTYTYTLEYELSGKTYHSKGTFELIR